MQGLNMMQNRKARTRWQDEMSLWPAVQWVFHIKVYTAHESWIFQNQWSQSPLDSSSPVMSFHWASVSLLFRHCFTFWSGIGLQFWLLTPKLKLSTGMNVCKSTNPRFLHEFRPREALWLQLPCTVCLWSKRFTMGKFCMDASYFYLFLKKKTERLLHQLWNHKFLGCHAQSPAFASGLRHAVRFKDIQGIRPKDPADFLLAHEHLVAYHANDYILSSCYLLDQSALQMICLCKVLANALH